MTDFLRQLRESPIEPHTVRGYCIQEPEQGWPSDFFDMILEMLRRGYDIVGNYSTR